MIVYKQVVYSVLWKTGAQTATTFIDHWGGIGGLNPPPPFAAGITNNII